MGQIDETISLSPLPIRPRSLMLQLPNWPAPVHANGFVITNVSVYQHLEHFVPAFPNASDVPGGDPGKPLPKVAVACPWMVFRIERMTRSHEL